MPITIRKQGIVSKCGDVLMLPIMYLLQFPSFERPQRTHIWNNSKYSVADIGHLDPEFFVSVAGDTEATKRWLGPLPIFHMPIFGGWRRYVVLRPKTMQDQWFIGWIPGDVIGISDIVLSDSVRLLRGPQTVYFFGLNEHGEQIELELIGEGELRKPNQFASAPLL